MLVAVIFVCVCKAYLALLTTKVSCAVVRDKICQRHCVGNMLYDRGDRVRLHAVLKLFVRMVCMALITVLVHHL